MSDSATRRGGTRRGRAGRRILLAGLGTLLALLMLEGAAGFLLAGVDASDTGLLEQVHCRHDPLLGWSHVPGFHDPDLYGPGRSLTVDQQGFRAREEYTREVPAGRYRILCLGDSFTLGYGVGDDDTYPAWLERLDPRVQAVNLGQGGYGVDQCWLGYERDGAALEADLVLLTFIAPDFERMLTDRFQGLYPKPRLEVVDGRLRRPAEPVPDTWREPSALDELERFWRGTALSDVLRRLGRDAPPPPPTSADEPLPHEALGELVLAALAGTARERGQRVSFAQIPLRDRRAGSPRRVARWMERVSARLDVPFLDLEPDFDTGSPGLFEAHYAADGHLNELGNRRLAELLLARLAERVDGLPRSP